MATDLDDALRKGRAMIREALVEAQAELDTLRARQAELEQQIRDAETALGETTTLSASGAPMTLHDALAAILRERGNQWMTVRELVHAVDARDLYRKRDGSPVEANQVHARTNNYSAIFEKNGANVRLREESPMLGTTPARALVFRDDDDGFFEWLDANPDGHFINTYRNPKPDYLVLHQPQCPHFKGSESLHWTKDYVKVCSPDRQDLEEWAATVVGGEVTLCRSCFDG